VDTQQVIELEGRYILHTYKRSNFVLERGEGVWLYDSEGRRYLDAVAGIAVNALGYGDPEILAVIEAQSRKLIHVSNLYHTVPHVLLAQALVENSFADQVFFCNSGTEAVEGALKFARKWAREKRGEGVHEFVAFTGSFHGRTFGALSVTATEKYRRPFEPLVPCVRFVPFNDVLAAQAVIDERTCAVIVEPVQGEGGVHLADAGFLPALRARCDEVGALLIFDEVQCGLGRTGYLWAHQAYGVMPDIMTLAKPLAGGLPMGAMLLTERVAAVIAPGDHGSTFAASPFVASVANVVFRRLSDGAFLAHVQEVGEYLEVRLRETVAGLPGVQEVRGRGLIWGIEIAGQAADVISAGYEEGIIVASAGDHVVRLLPPLIFEKEHVDMLVERLIPALRRAGAGQEGGKDT
jgi:acetylornithine/N-succinyldiaminopimelate aminotransferase